MRNSGSICGTVTHRREAYVQMGQKGRSLPLEGGFMNNENVESRLSILFFFT